MAKQLSLRIFGMTCGGCAASVEKALRGVEGVADASVQLMTESATVRLAGEDVPTGRLLSAVRGAGYDAEITPDGGELIDRIASDRETREQLRRGRQQIIQAIMYAVPIVVLDHYQHVLWSHNPGSQIAGRLMQIVLLVMLAVSPAGSPILVGGLRAVWYRAANMDLLISVGVIVAFASSIYGVFFAHDERFIHLHAAATILALVALGRYLEARAKGRASAAMTALSRRAPKTAWRSRHGEISQISPEDIAVGDLLHVPPHAAIPTDGEVVEGIATVDESLMTGEPLPVTRSPGDKVLGGTLVVEGVLLIQATAIGDRSTFGRIVQLVAQAQSGRTQMQRLADGVAAVFTPIVMAAGLLTLVAWLGWGGRAALPDAMRSAIAVLVVACPCALGLATPTVVMVASGTAALRGILVRDAAMLEAMGRVDTVVWDKTGTITSGLPSVRWIRLLGTFDQRALLALAASAEQFSTHPIARAIEAKARREGAELSVPSGFESVPGGGVAAQVDSHDVLVGSIAFLETRGVDGLRCNAKHGAVDDARDTLVAVAVDGRPAGFIALADTVRPSSADAVSRMHRQGLTSELLSGDTARAARAVADEVGIEIVNSDCSPADKVARIAQLRRDGRHVAMVGDGINDAAALAAADVGIAFATGADVAAEAAGINLIGSTPHLVADAVDLARAALRIIRQNLFWAFFYNVLMIPLAAAGKLSPGLAAGAMMISSLTVVLNALRLPRIVGCKTP